ncbi:8165_t:CDS:2 [Cetraspora pellucida]|uniref:8165_t:CDS:1 n=1 Tax=Cetraspora pellucida TaxID=1433469 RepID=A0ACA9K918_9GLOM|nr:8165_t:CDS:2 [Cetraspora pellucida]
MFQNCSHKLTKYVHVQDKLGPNQTAKRAICKACESRENIFEKRKNEKLKLWQFWVNEDQKIMMYKDADENMAHNAVRALRQARVQNDMAMSVVSSNSRASSASNASGFIFADSTQISETSSSSSHVSKQYEFNHLLLCLIIQNRLALRFTECSILRKLVDFFNPTVKIPCCNTLSTKILIEYADKLEQEKVSALSKLQEPVTIMFDGAEDINISNCSQKTPDVLDTINNFFERASNQNLNVVAMVMDSTSAYASARCKIRLQKRDIVFLPCFAHQANLCVSDIFKLSSEYKQTVKHAIVVASYFTDKRHLKAISLLRNEQQRIYKKIYSFMLPVATRWNSYYYCFAMLLRSKCTLHSYSILHSNSFELSDKSRIVIDDIQFWTYLEELVKHLLPFVSILNYLQHDAANLFDVAYVFGYVAQQYEDDIDGFGYQMQQKLETSSSFGHYFSSTILSLELTEYYMRRGIFSDKRFENTIETILTGDMSMNNAIGLALLRYWEFAAIDQKEIEECLENAKKIHQIVTKNLVTVSINSEEITPTPCREFQLESNLEPRNDMNDPDEHVPMPDSDEIPNDDYESEDYDSDDYASDESESIIREWVKVEKKKEREEEEEEKEEEGEEEEKELEELNAISFNAVNMRKYHPAEHKNSKIELWHLFTRDLSQPSFVRTLQQYDDSN